MISGENWQVVARWPRAVVVARQKLNGLSSKLASIRLPAFDNLWASPRLFYIQEIRHEALLDGIPDRRRTLHLPHSLRPKQLAELEHWLTGW